MSNEDGGPRSGRFVLDGVEHAYVSYAPGPLRTPSVLSSAEAEVAELIAAGRSNREIAQMRKVSVRTVENQISSIFRRLQLNSRAELLAILFDAPAENENNSR